MTAWELHAAPADTQPRWLDEVSEMRGRVLYDGGRRPSFRLPDGRFADPDRLDRHAHHLLARVDGRLVGCVRVVPVNGACGLTEQLLGANHFATALRVLGVERSRTIEGGRWMVDPTCRASRLAALLAAGGVAVARALGFEVLLCPVGTRGRQDRLLARLGLQPVPELPLVQVPQLDDELRVMYVHAVRPPTHFCELMDMMGEELRLSSFVGPSMKVAELYQATQALAS
jgi:hypothetical protein